MIKIEDRLQDSLERLEQDFPSGPELEGSPSDPEPLEPLLSAAGWLRMHAAAFDPDPISFPATEQRLVSSLPIHPRTSARIHPEYSARQRVAQLLLALALFAAGFLAASSLINASQTWIPGDQLYGLKTAQEKLVLDLTSGSARRASLHIQYAERRLLEAQALALEGRYDQLPEAVEDFSGHVDSAVMNVRLAASRDPALGAQLASQLERSLTDQSALVGLLAGAAPESSSRQLHLLLTVSQEGLASLEEFLLWDGG